MYAATRIFISFLFLFTLSSLTLAEDSTATKTPFSVQLPGTNVTLTPGMHIEQVRALMPNVEFKKIGLLGLFSFKLFSTAFNSEIGRYSFSGGLYKDRLVTIGLRAIDTTRTDVALNLDQWFRANVAGLTAAIHETTLSKGDTTETWTTPDVMWEFRTEKAEKTQNSIWKFSIEFLKED